MEFLVTKDACLILAAAYEKYLSRRKSGEDRTNAVQFMFQSDLTGNAISRMSPYDVSAAITELGRNKLLRVYGVGFNLTDLGIAVIEQRLLKDQKDIHSWIDTILSAALGAIPLIL